MDGLDLSALDFESVETLCLIDAVNNPEGAPLTCEPPHTIANDLGCQEGVDYVAKTENTATFDLNLPTMS